LTLSRDIFGFSRLVYAQERQSIFSILYFIVEISQLQYVYIKNILLQSLRRKQVQSKKNSKVTRLKLSN